VGMAKGVVMRLPVKAYLRDYHRAEAGALVVGAISYMLVGFTNSGVGWAILGLFAGMVVGLCLLAAIRGGVELALDFLERWGFRIAGKY
jgi:hypothetical protein